MRINLQVIEDIWNLIVKREVNKDLNRKSKTGGQELKNQAFDIYGVLRIPCEGLSFTIHVL